MTRLSESDLSRISARNRDAQSGAHFELFLPIATVSTLNQREHWAKRATRAKSQRQQAYLMTQALKSLRIPAIIKLVRVSPRMLDGDNLQGALKSVRDGIADRIGIDDGDPRISWQYGQEKKGTRGHGVLVTAWASMHAPAQ